MTRHATNETLARDETSFNVYALFPEIIPFPSSLRRFHLSIVLSGGKKEKKLRRLNIGISLNSLQFLLVDSLPVPGQIESFPRDGISFSFFDTPRTDPRTIPLS